jgi:predicted regulator of amino acid metabolism with ACT domain
MWDKVARCLEGYPERLAVAKILIKNGLCVKNGNVYCDEIMVSTLRISRAANVDRRTVTQTVKMIQKDAELSEVFRNIKPAGTSLREIARTLGLGVVEITPVDAKTPGILAQSALILAEANISIRQAIVDDPELTPEPKLTLIAEKKIPGELIPRLLKVKGVSKVSIY